ncbi:MAG: hypothetical protein COA57_06025 [Flavobacteriales bacterium]|nr:MAG: hypothetical protein COA57_06025 [Flavobacteriales bacterium]
MNRLWSLFVIVCICAFNSMAQNPTFIGGSTDGYGSASLMLTCNPDFTFQGGSGGGYASSTLSNPPSCIPPSFIIADDDGYGSGLFLPSCPSYFTFQGGNADGYSSSYLTSCTTFDPTFIGGNADGYSSALLTTTCASSLIFLGGNADGYSSSTLSSPPNCVPPAFIIADDDGYGSGLFTPSCPSFLTYQGGKADGSGSTSMSISCQAALPITLLEFNAKVIGQTVYTYWTTSSEINNDYYTVERSEEGYDYESIGYIEGAGYSNVPLTYNLVDEDPLWGLSYYRLKQTDFDGMYTYSNVIHISFIGGNAQFTIYPNPFSTSATLQFLLLPHISVTVVHFILYSVVGTEVKRKSYLSNSFQKRNTIEINRRNLKSGIYFFRLVTHQEVIVSGKLIIQ